MNRLLASIVLTTVCTAAAAAPTPAPVRAEIDALLARLQSSGCEFNRNGSWYSGAQARAHLLGKLEYFQGRGPVQSTEQFIALAASSSSITGKPYEVRCGGGTPVKSQQWLTKELGAVRSKP